MNRRDLAKAALALPLLYRTRAWSQVCANPCTTGAITPYLVVLQGPFALILHEDKPKSGNVTKITAVMPVDPMDKHHLAICGQPQDVTKHFSLALTQTIPPTPATLCVDSAFAYSCVDGIASTSSSKNLLVIDVAIPTRIIAEGSSFIPMDVVFKSKNPGKLQRSLVLEYDITNKSHIELTEQTSGIKIPLPATGPAYIEVGLAQPDTPSFDHAKSFYNGTLLPIFGLQKDPNHIIDSMTYNGGGGRTNTFDCKSGGIIGGTSP